MTKICVGWGRDVQPYVMQLASEHIETLREYCEDTIARILKSRKRHVLAVTARVNKSMLKAKAFHCFDKFGLRLRIARKQNQAEKARVRFELQDAARFPAGRHAPAPAPC